MLSHFSVTSSFPDGCDDDAELQYLLIKNTENKEENK